MGDITYAALVTLPPEFATMDLLTIQLWGGRPAYLFQVRHRAPCTELLQSHPTLGLGMT